jgi:hypothetical protein
MDELLKTLPGPVVEAIFRRHDVQDAVRLAILSELKLVADRAERSNRYEEAELVRYLDAGEGSAMSEFSDDDEAEAEPEAQAQAVEADLRPRHS